MSMKKNDKKLLQNVKNVIYKDLRQPIADSPGIVGLGEDNLKIFPHDSMTLLTLPVLHDVS